MTDENWIEFYEELHKANVLQQNIKTKEEMFNEFIRLKHDVQGLASIVQNDGMSVSVKELSEWSNSINDTMAKLHGLSKDVLNHYNNQSK